MNRDTAIVPPALSVLDPRIAERASQYADMVRNVFLTEGGWRCSDALYLIGGFARGELTADWHNGDLRIYNDLDFLVVTRRCGPRVLLGLRRIRRKLNDGRFGCTVDLVPVTRREILTPPPTIFHYDTQQHRRRVWGDDVFALDVQTLKAGDLSRSDALQLLLNRQASLLIGLEMLRRRDMCLPYLQVQLSKPLLAMMSATLTARGRYVVPAAQQLQRVETEVATEPIDGLSEFFQRPEVLRLLREAVEFRVRPNASHFAPARKRVQEIAGVYHEFLRTFLAAHYSIERDADVTRLVKTFRDHQPATCHPGVPSWWAARYRLRELGLLRRWDFTGCHPQIDVYAAHTLWLAELATGEKVDWRSCLSLKRRPKKGMYESPLTDLKMLIDAWKACGYGCRVQ